ncbi:D-cysteine desulfhydrase family protein [Aliagarivorans marinus]|uniref:D-cysteine desulfhydrase family protein n=1 Tax=Aliagarivorans marinus TaxID=561965 RepID=UPI0004197D97|nr:D-cysteine desulfhydrase family protein [Aliagarivorans marinus]
MPLSQRLPLGQLPTPVMTLPRLSQALGGPQLLIKRDDLTGLALGGNKVRKLAYLLSDALAKGHDCIITAGAAQSNHCRQTAAACAQLGLPCHLLLGGEPPKDISGNLLLDHLFGATVHWCGEQRKGEDAAALLAQLKSQGLNPYLVPYGGSSPIGALGFVDAIHELDKQMAEALPSHVVFASSSAGTHAGMLVGRAQLGHDYQLLGINIDKQPGELPFDERIYQLTQQTSELLATTTTIKRADLHLLDDYLGEGYGVVGDAEREAISLCARYEGILLDPVYTGRAMAGLIDLIRQGRLNQQHRVLFWHTGGAPALFAYADQLQLT